MYFYILHEPQGKNLFYSRNLPYNPGVIYYLEKEWTEHKCTNLRKTVPTCDAISFPLHFLKIHFFKKKI